MAPQRGPPQFYHGLLVSALRDLPRFPALLGTLVFLAVWGSIIAFLVRRAERGDLACARTDGQTELTAILLWTDAGGGMGPAPEVWDTPMDALRPLSDPDDAVACARLREVLPDTLGTGLGAPQRAAFYQAGDLYIVPVIPNYTRAEIEAMSRDDYSAARSGRTWIFRQDFTPLASYEN